jgi:hypothetical protein
MQFRTTHTFLKITERDVGDGSDEKYSHNEIRRITR